MSHKLLYFYIISLLIIVTKNIEALIGKNVRSAEPNDYPFIVSIGFEIPTILQLRIHFCGGSLITRTHVLTAAHCFDNVMAHEINVIIGEHDLSTANYKYDVNFWITYDYWAGSLKKSLEYPTNDIAIATLTSPVNRVDVTVATLTSLNNQQLHGKKAMIAGWGLTKEGEIQNILQKATVKILSPEECTREIRLITNFSFTLGKHQLCSWSNPYVLSSCYDSGGPLLGRNNVLLGIARGTCPNETMQWGDFTLEFLNKYKINVHPSVDYYRDFIEAVSGLATRIY